MNDNVLFSMIILVAVRALYPHDQRPMDREVEVAVLNALKYAKDRAGGRKRRQEAKSKDKVGVAAGGRHRVQKRIRIEDTPPSSPSQDFESE